MPLIRKILSIGILITGFISHHPDMWAQQHVGIGTTTPEYPLDVNGRMRIRNNGFSSGLWFNKTDNSEAAFIGLINDSTAGFWGNGTTGNWRMSVDLRNGQLGVGTASITAPLTLNNTLGNKIAIYSNGNGTQYGIGLRASLMQFYTDIASSDMAFGIGSSGSFTENVRFKGNGQVGIGTSTVSSGDRMELNGRLRLRRDVYSSGIWFNNSSNTTATTDGVFVGLSNETAGSEVWGIWTNGAWRVGFDRSGNATLSGLAGTGTRAIGANANGKLVPMPQSTQTAFNANTLANILVLGGLVETYIYLSNVAYDPGLNYRIEGINSLSYYSVPETGVYHFNVSVRWTGNAAGVRRIFLRDGSGYLLKAFEAYPPNAQIFNQQYSFEVNLDAGTEVHLFVSQNSGSNLNIEGVNSVLDVTTFSGYKVN